MPSEFSRIYDPLRWQILSRFSVGFSIRQNLCFSSRFRRIRLWATWGKLSGRGILLHLLMSMHTSSLCGRSVTFLHFHWFMLMKFCQIPVSISEAAKMNDESLKNELVIQKPLDPWMTLSEVFSQPLPVHPKFLVIELPGQFIPLSPVPPPTGSVWRLSTL